MTRHELMNTYPGIYQWLLKNNRGLLNKHFPFRNNSKNNKKILLEMARNGKDKPNKTAIKLRDILYSYTNKKRDSYDKQFTNKLKQLRPDWFVSKNELLKKESYKRMLSLMPYNVTFKKGQKWKGVVYKYTFIHKEYGKFISSPISLINQSWKKGLSGHPEDKYMRMSSVMSRSVINLDTGEIFDSINIAAKKMKVTKATISAVCNGRNKTAKTYRWAHYNPENHIIKGEKYE